MDLSLLSEGMVALVGVPHDAHSSFLRGPAAAPEAIRQVLYSGAGNLCTEGGLDLASGNSLVDLGDLEITNDDAGYGAIEGAFQRILETGARTLTLGGDHAIAFPVIKAHAARHPGLTVLQLDAHPDLYDELGGDRYSHACPFARLLELTEGGISRLVQVGIRTLNPHQRSQAERFGVEIIEMRDWTPDRSLPLPGPVYLSLDLDVVDPAFAPGVSHHEPGGMTSRQVIGLIQRLEAQLVGAEIVELNPSRDASGVSAALAAKLLKEIAEKLLLR